MQSAFSACLLAAAVNAAAKSVLKDEYKFSKENPMGTTTGAAGFGDKVTKLDYLISLEQFDDHSVVITKTFDLTLKADFAPPTANAAGELLVCEKPSTNYECDVASWNSVTAKLGYYELAAKPTKEAIGGKVAAGPGGSAVDKFLPSPTASDCESINDFTFATSTKGAAASSAICKKREITDVTWTSPNLKWSVKETVTNADAATAKAVLTAYETTAKTLVAGMSLEDDSKREREVFD